jgi:hypothetical protein
MKIRTTVILFVIFALALLTFGAYQWLGVQTGEEKKHTERYVFPSLNPLASSSGPNVPAKVPAPKVEDFTRIIIERYKNEAGKTEKIEFARDKGAKWQMTAPQRVRTDDSVVTGLVTTLMGLEKQKARDLGRDLSKYSLDKPDTVITLAQGSQEYTLALGSTGPATKDSVLYATSSESTGKPILLTKTKIERVFDPIASFRDKSLIGSSFDITDIRLAGTARQPMELVKDKDWSFKEPALGDADTNTTDELGRTLAGIRVERNEDFVYDGALDEAKLNQYGVDENKAAYIATVTRKPFDTKDKPITEKIIVGKADESSVDQVKKQRQAALAVESAFINPLAASVAYLDREKQKIEPAYYYARLAGDNSIIRISAKNLPYLQKAADDLRLKSLAKIDNSKVDAINLNSGGEALRLRRPDLKAAAEWELFANGKNKVMAQMGVVQNLLDAIGKIEIKDAKAFLDDDGKIKSWFGTDTIDLGLDKPQAELLLWQEGLQRDKDGKPEGTPEPKLKDNGNVKPSVKFSIGKKDSKRNVVYVRREVPNLKPAVLAVPDPFISGAANLGAQQALAQPPDSRQSLSLTSLVSLGYLAFREHSLPSFRTDQVASVEMKRGNVTYFMERQEKPDEAGGTKTDWKLKQPVEGTPPQPYPELLVSSLTSTSADKLITDKATDKDLTDVYGLKSPVMQITVKTKPEPAKPADAASKEAAREKPGSTYTYSIGKKLADNSKYAQHYYARLETKPGEGSPPEANQFVFALPLSYLQSVDVELRDTTIFPRDAAKPTSISFTWNAETADKKPMVTKLDLALNNETWEIKSLTENGADAKSKLAKLDQNKVNAFLSYGPQPAFAGPRINPLAVDRFLQHNGQVDPKYRLDPAKKDAPPKLIIEAKYADGKTNTAIFGDVFKPTEATFPSLTGNYYYLATPSLPGVVTIVGDFGWRGLIDGYTYFQDAPPKTQQ